MSFARLKLLGVGTGIVFLVTLVFLQTGPINTKRHNAVMDELRRLKQLDAIFNQELLQLRFGLVSSYDAAGQTLHALKAAHQQLSHGPAAISQQGHAEMDRRLEAFREALEAKAASFEQFAAENATLNNSIRFFPLATTRLLADVEGEAALSLQVNQLLRDVLMYNLTASQELKPEIRDRLEELRQGSASAPPEVQRQLHTVLTHARVILEQKETVDGFVRELMAMPTADAIEGLYESYLRFYAQALRRSSLYRNTLYAVCLLLIGVIMAIMAQLSRNVRLLELEIQERKHAEANLRETQAQLVQSEKLAAIGHVASGIAHEVKNPLAILSQGLEYFRKNLDLTQASTAEALTLMEEAVKRANMIVREVLTFARPAQVSLSPAPLNPLLERAVVLVEKQLGVTAIVITKELAKELPLVSMDQNQMQQVFINLLTNAAQAMSNRGRLTLRTSTAVVAAGEAGVGHRATDPFKPEQPVVVCEIADTGCGIPKDKLNKIFEPFFTTKPLGEGTGLGLAIVRSIIQAHRGVITVESQEGQGTTFQITLPALVMTSPL
ncbi:MAG: hypothetical protein HY596_01435 [Candidatus Omnitrophica bacterium]|nr:hypothetical protein [Candidatus Omnitrophota bacterium]